jgi:hypothetical protein
MNFRRAMWRPTVAAVESRLPGGAGGGTPAAERIYIEDYGPRELLDREVRTSFETKRV